MPIYGYRCKSCNHTFEVTQSISDEPIKTCPECEGPVGKIFFPVGISFKGSGFYSTDNKSSKGKTGKELVSKNEGESKSNDSKSNNGNGNGCSSCTTCSSAATFGDN